ncbi:hypothetical protein U1Q18_009266 [Sarracenia purpurea var. burkii]
MGINGLGFHIIEPEKFEEVTEDEDEGNKQIKPEEDEEVTIEETEEKGSKNNEGKNSESGFAESDEDDTELNEEEEGAEDVSGSTEKEIEQGFRNLRFLREQVILLPNTNIPDAYANVTSEEQAFIQNLALVSSVTTVSKKLGVDEHYVDVDDKLVELVIDDISNEDSSAVGVTWHLGMMKKFSYLSFHSFLLINTNDSASKQLIMGVTEWKGKPFLFSKGCSFYRLDAANGKRQIL